ncbi:MAG: hypothetical protein DMF81_17120 [Acidobacteria bacterium]|nr:MAG: hypothetical protein DMF81_17120 [Acidobacteriota bacterium]
MNRRLLRAAGVGLLAVAGALAPAPPPSSVRAEPAATGRRAFAAAHFAVSPRLRDLPPEPRFRPEDVVDDVRVRPPRFFRVEAAGVAPSVDAARQASLPEAAALPAPSVSFDGLSSADNGALFGFRVSPPDTNGDVGPSHYVEIVNLAYRVYDKSGQPLTRPAS